MEQNSTKLVVVVVVIIVAVAACILYWPAIKWSYRALKAAIKQHHAEIHAQFDEPKV